MAEEFAEIVYLCPKCLQGQEAAGPCPNDGTQLIECEPGSRDDPARRPIIDNEGRVLTRAPRWWLNVTVREIMSFLDKKKRG